MTAGLTKTHTTPPGQRKREMTKQEQIDNLKAKVRSLNEFATTARIAGDMEMFCKLMEEGSEIFKEIRALEAQD